MNYKILVADDEDEINSLLQDISGGSVRVLKKMITQNKIM